MGAALEASESGEESALHRLHIGDLDSAWHAAEAGIKETYNDRLLRAYWIFRFVRAEVLRIRGRTQEALSYLESLSPPFQQDVEMQTALTMHRGYCSALLGRYKEAHPLLKQAEAVAISAGLLELLAEIKVRQAMVAYLEKDFHTSERLYKSVADTYGDEFGWYLDCVARGGVGKSLMARQELKEALPWLKGAVATAEAVGSSLLVAGLSGEVAICYLALGDADEALRIHLEADKVLDRLGARHAYQVNLMDTGNVYLQKGEYLTAISYYQRALAIAKEINAPPAIEKCIFNTRIAYARLRNTMDPGARQ